MKPVVTTPHCPVRRRVAVHILPTSKIVPSEIVKSFAESRLLLRKLPDPEGVNNPLRYSPAIPVNQVGIHPIIRRKQ